VARRDRLARAAEHSSRRKVATRAYAITSIQERTILFVEPGMKVYGGMVVGENAREAEMVVQIIRAKHLTNMRASSSDIVIPLEPARIMTLGAVPRVDR